MKIILLSENAKIPTKANHGDAGFDLYSPIDIIINPGEYKLIKLDIAITDFPPETYGRIAPRSSLGMKGVHVLAGVIDSTFQGNIGVILFVNSSAPALNIKTGDRIAQIIFERYHSNIYFEQVDFFDKNTERGNSGFGSTGI